MYTLDAVLVPAKTLWSPHALLDVWQGKFVWNQS